MLRVEGADSKGLARAVRENYATGMWASLTLSKKLKNS